MKKMNEANRYDEEAKCDEDNYDNTKLFSRSTLRTLTHIYNNREQVKYVTLMNSSMRIAIESFFSKSSENYSLYYEVYQKVLVDYMRSLQTWKGHDCTVENASQEMHYTDPVYLRASKILTKYFLDCQDFPMDQMQFMERVWTDTLYTYGSTSIKKSGEDDEKVELVAMMVLETITFKLVLPLTIGSRDHNETLILVVVKLMIMSLCYNILYRFSCRDYEAIQGAMIYLRHLCSSCLVNQPKRYRCRNRNNRRRRKEVK